MKGYLGGKYAFNKARIPIDDPDGMGPIDPFGLYLRRVYDFDSNRPVLPIHKERKRKERNSLPRPSIDEIVPEIHRHDLPINWGEDALSNNDSDENEYRTFKERKYEYSESKRNVNDDYDDRRRRPNDSYDPTDEIASFFESSDSRRRRS